MKIVGVSGVKGGVGKSTFAVLLALELNERGKKVLLVDADVEAPNDHLLLNKKLENLFAYTYQKIPTVDKNLCKECGACSKVCRSHAIFWVKGSVPKIIETLCSGCGACELVCPTAAIRMEDHVSGEIYLTSIKENLWLMTGVSKPGLSETGPVVKQLMEYVTSFAEKRKVDYVIVDTAPGSHCNVIYALRSVDKVFAVTEPTPLGSYDLRVMLELTKKLEVETEIVINKADIGNVSNIKKISEEYNTPIRLEIPYDEKLVELYSNGRIIEFFEKFRPLKGFKI